MEDDGVGTHCGPWQDNDFGKMTPGILAVLQASITKTAEEENMRAVRVRRSVRQPHPKSRGHSIHMHVHDKRGTRTTVTKAGEPQFICVYGDLWIIKGGG